MLYPIYRNETVVAEVWPDGKREKEIMIKNIVRFSFESPVSVEFAIGDKITVWGETYYLNQLDEPTKDSSINFKYSLEFQAAWYSLAKPKLFFYDALNLLKVIKFEVMINASQLLDLIVANANRTQSGWTRGDCVDSEYKLLAFNGESVLQSIDIASREFETEHWIENKVIHLTKKGIVSGYRFSYGYNLGLRGGLTRTNVDTSSVFSRLYVTGSDQNLPLNYRDGQKTLLLPAGMDYIQGPIYGNEEIEAVMAFPEVRPERIGTVSSVTSPFIFSDNQLDFDINIQTLPGISAKVSFLTGDLAGYNFEISKGGYNHATRTITIITNEVEKAFTLPSTDLKPKVGDTYYFFDIIMPASYVQAKEIELLEKATEYFNQKSVPRVSYTVPPDHFYFKRNNIRLNLGDYVEIADVDLRIDKSIRVYSYEQDLHNEFEYDALKISDIPVGSSYIRQVAANEKLQKNLALNRISDINRSRMNWKTNQELLNQYFDPSSKQIFTEAISPVTLRALMIQTGDASQQLVLNGINFKSNYEGDPNKLAWSGGQLIHATIEASPRTWNIPGAVASNLEPGKSYYVYAKCNRITGIGEIMISEEQVTVDQDPEFFHFWIGFANSVIDNYRVLKSVYGSVSIYGRTIEGGIIFGNNLEINLDQGTITGKVIFGSGSTGYDNITDKPDLSLFATQQDINDLNEVLTNLDEYIDSAFSDGIIKEAEAKAIEKYINTLNSESNDIESRYSALYNNQSLPTADRDDLVANKNAWNIGRLNLINSINTAISDGKTTPEEKADVDAKFAAYRTTIGALSTSFERAINAVAVFIGGQSMAVALEAKNYINNVLPGVIGDIQNQLDGQLESFFQQVDPSLSNYPAVNWNTPALKEQHSNDTYSNTSTGQSWRWVFENGNWIWKVISDTATQQALVLAGQALDTADGKRRVFVVQPTTPYDVGDLWAQGGAGELMRCTTARSSGAYSSLDWGKATGYTDDSAVNDLAVALGGMAYEDAVELAKLGETIVQGGYIKANLIDVLLLIVRNLRTANVGEKRVSINGVNNNIQIISGDNTVLIEADDDSAIDSFNGTTPIYGPGFRVGPQTGDNSTLSGKLIRVYKSSNNKQSYIAPEAIYSDGFMNIWGAYANLLGNFRVTPTRISFDNVDIFADGAQGFTGYELVSSSGPQTRKYVKGIYIGIGPNDHW